MQIKVCADRGAIYEGIPLTALVTEDEGCPNEIVSDDKKELAPIDEIKLLEGISQNCFCQFQRRFWELSDHLEKDAHNVLMSINVILADFTYRFVLSLYVIYQIMPRLGSADLLR